MQTTMKHQRFIG